jgi:hypothetical protein
MCLLLLSLKAIERVCTQKRSNASCDEKALHSEKKGTKQPGTDNMARVPKKPRNTATFARSMGAPTQLTILKIAIGLRKTEQKKSFLRR